MKKTPSQLKPAVVFAPTATEFAQEVDTTRNHLLLTTLENVQGRAYVYSLTAERQVDTDQKLDVPDNESVGIVTGNSSDDHFFVSLTGFLTPFVAAAGRCLGYVAETGQGAPAAVRRLTRCCRTVPRQFRKMARRSHISSYIPRT